MKTIIDIRNKSMIFDLLKDLNQDCNFTENIKESNYIQGENSVTEVSNTNNTYQKN